MPREVCISGAQPGWPRLAGKRDPGCVGFCQTRVLEPGTDLCLAVTRLQVEFHRLQVGLTMHGTPRAAQGHRAEERVGQVSGYAGPIRSRSIWGQIGHCAGLCPD